VSRAARIALVSALALPGACGEPAAPAAPARRVILITCDTLRFDHLGAYGYDRPTSPHLDAFAREAVLYERAFTSAPVTSPALSSLMAGRLPDAIGVSGGNRSFMPASVDTLAEVARAAGLATGAVVSNWVLRRPGPADGDVGLPQGFDQYDDRMTERELNRQRVAERAAPDTTDAAIAWLQARLDQGQDRLFLWVHYQDPHGPYTPPDDFAQRFARPHEGEAPLPLSENVHGLGAIPSYQALGDERRPGVYVDRYDAEIAYFDEALGRLLAWLREHGLWDDSLIVFTADHGEALGEHDYWFCHGENTYVEAVRVPLLVRFPQPTGGAASPAAPAAPGQRRPELVGHLDLFPTVLDALGLPPRPLGGRSLYRPPADGKLLAQTLFQPGRARRWDGLTDGRWALVRHDGQPGQLFDLGADPREDRDLAGQNGDVVAGMQLSLEQLLRAAGRVAAAGTRPLSAEEQARLQAMGYTGGDEDG